MSTDIGRVRRWAVASLIANIAIVITGGAVRLTASGLGCPTWPRCSEDSFIPTGEAGIHSAIEFGNRLMTFVLVAIAVGTLMAAWRHRPRRPRLRRPALLLALGIPAQAVIGGLSVLTNLNPWVVSGHFLVSMVLIGVAVVLIRRAGPAVPPSPGEPRAGQLSTTHPLLGTLSLAVLAVTGVVVWLGTMTTASGPHAGDAAAPRTGWNLQLVAQVHADVVFFLLGLTIATLVATRMLNAPPRIRQAALVLLIVEVGQGIVGYTQWFAGLPGALVAVHMLGASLAVAAATDLYLAARPALASNGHPRADPVRAPSRQMPTSG